MSKSRAAGPASAEVMKKSAIQRGKPYPMGATADKNGINFAIFSAHATKVEVCLFDKKGESAHFRPSPKTPATQKAPPHYLY